VGVADDPRNVGVEIELGGRKLVMRMTVKTMRLMKEATGGVNPNAEGGLLSRLDGGDPDDLAILFWALLYSNDPRPTLDEVSDCIDVSNLAPLIKAYNEVRSRNSRAAEGSPADPQ
jgi:hypothetical protein